MRKSTLYLSLLTALLSCSYSIQAYAGTCWNGGYEGSAPWHVKAGPGGPDSVAYDDVNYCVNTVAGRGDSVHVPAGSATWTSMLRITKEIKLQGAGIDNTVIINGIINTRAGDFLISIAPVVLADNPHIEITGFTFDANSEGGCIRISCEDNTYAYTNFQVHNNKLKNTLKETVSD